MNQPVAGPVGVPGGGGSRTGKPGSSGTNWEGGTRQPVEGGRIAGSGRVSAGPQDTAAATDTERLLSAVEGELNSLDRLAVPDQLPVYDRLHSTLADALARTADTGAPPGPGESGA